MVDPSYTLKRPKILPSRTNPLKQHLPFIPSRHDPDLVGNFIELSGPSPK